MTTERKSAELQWNTNLAMYRKSLAMLASDARNEGEVYDAREACYATADSGHFTQEEAFRMFDEIGFLNDTKEAALEHAEDARDHYTPSQHRVMLREMRDDTRVEYWLEGTSVRY